ncbi:glycerophosphodiester phosphodiesterase family protein [Amphibacillus xylanus]|uniref:Glycerophosphoryl diester phosphodiesterase n=1 Tax=Amphibacillus xylanus (strain ATCC 51415 / DSM 6626 / JCM 7361 / LMG 17667 / NBRC 15112 / Ep01) TaxID=698758 RepID=K0J535_AMPXN|nr:glycerophosphodiester phosphodiesterase family protein [Amphibacillus xylanus]BAM48522.1 glycerophosphoryl diester phosphodiesterase [Amphibacillus xylanus NBRC 15112]
MTKVFGHRGSKGYFPENTLLSFHEAIRAGVDGIELDVHLTKDRQLVVIHDATVDRTFDGSGYVKDFNLVDLKRLKLNQSFKSFTHYQSTWDLERIPTLEEALEIFALAKIDLNIELKTTQFDYPGIEEMVISCVKQYAPSLNVIYSSFHLPTLARLRACDPNCNIGFLVEQPIPLLQDYLKQFQLNKIHLDKSLIKHIKMTSDISMQDIKVWTVNKTSELIYFLNKEVDTIITDFPDRALQIRHELKANSS